MRIFAISDLHLDTTNSKPMDVFGEKWSGHTDKILESIKKNALSFEDVLIVAGDLSWAMKLEDAKKDLEFFKQIPTNIIIVKGNHEYWWQSISLVRNSLPDNMQAIQNDAIKLGNFVFCGTRGWVLPDGKKELSKEDQKIYDREVIRLKLSIDEAKKLAKENDEIICVMHYPPFNNKLDDNEYLRVLKENNIKTVVFGHLHGCKLKTEINDITCYLTSCDFLNNEILQIK